MSSKLSFREVRALSLNLSRTCEGILFRAGPFLKEGIYQDLLLHELHLQGIHTSREVVFNYQFQDSQGNTILLGNNQCLRSDVELPHHHGIVEVKSTTATTKMESMWQLRNYLEQRPDRSWGAILNFTSKFGTKTAPKVQCDTLYKVSNFTNEITQDTWCPDTTSKAHAHFLHSQGSDGTEYCISRYYSEQILSKDYPVEDEIFIPPSSPII